LSPVVVTPVAGPAPLSPVAVLPELDADDVPAAPSAVVVPATFPSVLCLLALLSCLQSTDFRHIRLTALVARHAGSGTITSEVLKASRTKHEDLRNRVLDSGVVHLGSGLAVSDLTDPGLPEALPPSGTF
jgi:hypothetical protein